VALGNVGSCSELSASQHCHYVLFAGVPLLYISLTKMFFLPSEKVLNSKTIRSNSSGLSIGTGE